MLVLLSITLCTDYIGFPIIEWNVLTKIDYEVIKFKVAEQDKFFVKILSNTGCTSSNLVINHLIVEVVTGDIQT